MRDTWGSAHYGTEIEPRGRANFPPDSNPDQERPVAKADLSITLSSILRPPRVRDAYERAERDQGSDPMAPSFVVAFPCRALRL